MMDWLRSKTRATLLLTQLRTLKKEMLFAINFSATQELDRQLQAEKDKVASLEARISALEKN